jgi:predicted pyridoxine 5'-phosphate oxidase superfamily flavin-nucleotide-binding protein
MGNASTTAKMGLLFIDFTDPNRLRVHGEAHVSADDPLLESWVGAQLVIRVDVTEVFPNCPRYIHEMQLVERSRFVPRGDPPPIPDWKCAPWAIDALPANDPARQV